jgi:hypothetical protein
MTDDIEARQRRIEGITARDRSVREAVPKEIDGGSATLGGIVEATAWTGVPVHLRPYAVFELLCSGDALVRVPLSEMGSATPILPLRLAPGVTTIEEVEGLLGAAADRISADRTTHMTWVLSQNSGSSSAPRIPHALRDGYDPMCPEDCGLPFSQLGPAEALMLEATFELGVLVDSRIFVAVRGQI